VDDLAELEHLLEAAEITADLSVGLVTEQLPTTAASRPPGGWYRSSTRTAVPPWDAGVNWTEPVLGMVASSTERQTINSFGWSSMSSAVHSMLAPAGVRAVQRERRASSTRTRSRCCMNCGRFSKLRQKR
jgi:hypothetical protein